MEHIFVSEKLPELYSIKKCFKCGYIRREYCTWGDYGATSFTYKYAHQELSFYHGQLHVNTPECIVATCNHCGYSWKEACLDIGKEK